MLQVVGFLVDRFGVSHHFRDRSWELTMVAGRNAPYTDARLAPRWHGLTLIRVSAMLAGASIVWFAVRCWHPFGPPVLGWVPVPILPLLAVVASRRLTHRLTRRPGLATSARRFWRNISFSSAVLSVSAVTAAYDSLGGPGPPVQHLGPLTNALFILSTTFGLQSVLHLPRRGRSRGEWFTASLDLGIVLVSIALVAWRFSRPGYARTSSLAQLAVWVSVTALVLVAVPAVVKMTRLGLGDIDRQALGILGGSVVVGIVAGVGMPMLAGRPDLSVLMPTFPLVYFLVILAAEVQGRVPTVPAPRPQPSARQLGRRRLNLLPYVAIASADGLLLATMRGVPDVTRLMIAGSVALTGFVIVRQLVAFADNVRLLSQVDTSMLALQRHEQRFRSLIQHSDDVISIIDGAGQLTYNSPAIFRVLGLDPQAMTGMHARPSVHPDDLSVVEGLFDDLRGHPNTSVRGEVRIRHADGTYRWFDVTYTNLLDDPSVQGVVGNARDITDNRAYQDQLAYTASHDELTGLANRSLFTSQIKRAAADGAPGTVAVALVDLDDFKTINDRFGHAVGDALLVAVSAQLRLCVRPADLVARLGGDEFAILLTDVSPGTSESVAYRVMTALREPIDAVGLNLLIQPSIGVVDSESGTDADTLLHRADLAMYAAKERGKNRHVHYDAALEARATEHAQLAAELSHALARNELHLLYQPIVSLPTGQVMGAEALVRWDHPREGQMSPLRFISVAERTGLIVPLGEWVLRTACAQAVDWHRRYGADAPERISVNVSALQLLEPSFPRTVASVLAETGLRPAQLIVEITETAVFGGGPAVETVAAIRALGVRIALDDFGTGHSSLGLLRTCPVDVIKVDKSFVDGVTGILEEEAIAKAIIEIAQALGLGTVAEGVETAAQAARLYDLGYRRAQGFYFAKPLRPVDIEALFAVAGSSQVPVAV